MSLHEPQASKPLSTKRRLPHLAFATPRKLPKASTLPGRVVVLDIAFAAEGTGAGFEKVTWRFIADLGERLAAWVDHHDHVMHARFADDPRFVLAKKSDFGSCPEMIGPELVERVGEVDTILCHGDFDGLCAGAKWILGGVEPYPGADADARAIDTRLGEASPTAQRIERALKVRPKDDLLRAKIIHYLVGACEDPKAFVAELEAMGAEALAFEQRARALSERFEIDGPIAFCDARNSEPFDKTALLLLGQERALISVVLDDQSLTVAAPFNSGINLIEILGLSGGMPTRVSLRPSSAKEVMEKLRAWASVGSTK